MCLFPVSHHQLQHKKVIRRQYYAYTLSLKSSMMRHSMILRSCCQIWRWKMIRAISFRIVFTRGAWRHFWPPWNPFGGLEIWSSLFPNLSLQSSSAKSTISFACNNRGDRAYFGKTTALLLSRLDRTRAIFQPHPIEITSAIILLKQFQDQIQDRL